MLYVGGTTKYLKRDVHMLMPTKLKGMTSVEIAIIAAVLLVIAVAVGWYLYTTFVANVGANPRIQIISALGYESDNSIRLEVFNPGPLAARITQVEVAGTLLSIASGPVDLSVGARSTVVVNVPTSVARLVAGTTITGRVILSGGQSFPFTAAVRP